MNRIIILVEDGVIQDVIAGTPEMEYMIIDRNEESYGERSERYFLEATLNRKLFDALVGGKETS